MTETLAAYSLVAVYSAIAVYAIAFVALRARSGEARVAGAGRDLEARRRIRPRVRGIDPRRREDDDRTGGLRRRRRYQRVAFALTVLAWVIHVAAIALRAFAAGRVPWANLFEFTVTGRR